MMLSQPTRADRAAGNVPGQKPTDLRPTPVHEETTIDLLNKARGGDRLAVEVIMQRSLPSLKRWAHGRLPVAARGSLDTVDLVQDATFSTLKRLHLFEPRHAGAMQAYLRQAVINRIRDEVRRLGRHPAPLELLDEHPATGASPLEAVLEAESSGRYREALGRLRPRDRALVTARVEAEWSLQEIATRFGMSTVDAARMAVRRALRRLARESGSTAVSGPTS